MSSGLRTTPPDPPVARGQEHRIEIVSKFSAKLWDDGYTAECPCGWSSAPMPTQTSAVRKGLAHIQEVAK